MKDAELSRVDLNLLVSLQALLTEASVSRAADAVGLTQPAMSNALKRLRRLFDDELLVREAGAYALSPRARELAEPLDRALGLLKREVLWPGPFDPTRSERVFTVAATNAAATLVIPPLMRRVQQQSSTLGIRQVRLGDDVDTALATSDVDVALVPDGMATPLPRERLLDEAWSLVVSPNHPILGRSTTPDELARHPFAVFESDGVRTPGDLALASALPTQRALVRTDDFVLLALLVADGQLVAVVQEPIARRFAGRNSLRIIESPVALPPLRIDLVWPPGSAGDQGRAWLARQLHEIGSNHEF